MKRSGLAIFAFLLLILTNLPAQNTKHSLVSGKIVYEINFPVDQQKPQSKETMPKEMTFILQGKIFLVRRCQWVPEQW
ncbi:MAG: hypothetical protein IPP51_10290 [Bacteroidetes bacterium]|nr:hypothetical protein [Bacteroidota bacterium]